MLNPSPAELARICRTQASLTSDTVTKECFLRMAAEYEAKAAFSGPSLSSLFFDEASGTFESAFVFRADSRVVMTGAGDDHRGYWRCDLSNGEKLTWSDEVYDLFGLRLRDPVEREWAAGRYARRSRTTLERVRDHAIRRCTGFILDAEIHPAEGRSRLMRVLAMPRLDPAGHIVGLEGLKREL